LRKRKPIVERLLTYTEAAPGTDGPRAVLSFAVRIHFVHAIVDRARKQVTKFIFCVSSLSPDTNDGLLYDWHPLMLKISTRDPPFRANTPLTRGR